MPHLHTRRSFLQRGLTVLSAAVTMPQFLQNTVYALNNPADQPLTQAAAGKSPSFATRPGPGSTVRSRLIRAR